MSHLHVSSEAIANIDITTGNPANDPRVIQYIREIKQLKQKVELQTELNRQLERDKNRVQSQLDSYTKRCNDLQKNLDDKDQHLNEVVASLIHKKKKNHKRKKSRSGWFGFESPNINNMDISNIAHDDTAAIDISPSSSTISTVTTNDEHDPNDIYSYGTTISVLINMDPNEMEFKIKSASKDKLRNYIRDIYEQYHTLNKEKCDLFQDLVKATHNMGWTQKLADNKDKQCVIALEKEKAAKNHIKSLEKSLAKERKKITKYKKHYEILKQNAIKERKEKVTNEKKWKHIITTKDEFIARACSKLIVYKDRLSQFEVSVFHDYLTLISPSIQDLVQNKENMGDIEMETKYIHNKKKMIKYKKQKVKKKKKKIELDLELDLDEVISSDDDDVDDDDDETVNENHQLSLDLSHSMNDSNNIELKLVKYPATGELYLVIGVTEMEIFRNDFAKCTNIEKNQNDIDFTIYFENIALVFRGDHYEKVMGITVKLRLFLEQHSTNLEPELPPAPTQTVTDQMNIFFGGF